MLKIVCMFLLISSASFETQAARKVINHEFMIKYAEATNAEDLQDSFPNARIDKISETWFKVELTTSKAAKSKSFLKRIKADPEIEYLQPNYAIELPDGARLQDPLRRAAVERFARRNPSKASIKDNPIIPPAPKSLEGTDPLLEKQWAAAELKLKDVWKIEKGKPEVVVAIVDTGIDYTHEDLLPSLWRNPGETGVDAQGVDKSSNGIDDDGNGFIDDQIGWDFVQNDNLPFDLTVDPLLLLSRGGNPGQGTHLAGIIAARSQNLLGGAGIAPQVRVMALRAISQNGHGSTATVVKAIRYAADQGAKVIVTAWEAEGEGSSVAGGKSNLALQEAIQYAQSRGALVIASAGNGELGSGFNNDSHGSASYPASYEMPNIVSVTAVNAESERALPANWGFKSVDIAAPGVDIFSTTADGDYGNMILDSYGFHVGWDGTQLAAAHVAGAAALYWSKFPQKEFGEVKAAILESAKKIPAMENSCVSEGKLDILALLKKSR